MMVVHFLLWLYWCSFEVYTMIASSHKASDAVMLDSFHKKRLKMFYQVSYLVHVFGAFTLVVLITMESIAFHQEHKSKLRAIPPLSSFFQEHP
jgi:hypothetical protein